MVMVHQSCHNLINVSAAELSEYGVPKLPINVSAAELSEYSVPKLPINVSAVDGLPKLPINVSAAELSEYGVPKLPLFPYSVRTWWVGLYCILRATAASSHTAIFTVDLVRRSRYKQSKVPHPSFSVTATRIVRHSRAKTDYNKIIKRFLTFIFTNRSAFLIMPTFRIPKCTKTSECVR